MPQHQMTAKDSTERRKSNIGVFMTVFYAVVYGGFVFLSVFYPSSMSLRTFFGMNLAITYGLSLIVIAIIFAMIYNQLVRIPRGAKKPEGALKTDQGVQER
jgi:uncharacterized membrane protein (DUF485 family)